MKILSPKYDYLTGTQYQCPWVSSLILCLTDYGYHAFPYIHVTGPTLVPLLTFSFEQLKLMNFPGIRHIKSTHDAHICRI